MEHGPGERQAATHVPGTGAHVGIEKAVDQLVTFERDFEPNKSERSYYDTRFGKYQDLYGDLKSFNAGFVAV